MHCFHSLTFPFIPQLLQSSFLPSLSLNLIFLGLLNILLLLYLWDILNPLFDLNFLQPWVLLTCSFLKCSVPLATVTCFPNFLPTSLTAPSKSALLPALPLFVPKLAISPSSTKDKRIYTTVHILPG